jgi:uncharacterized protein YbaR (Trm112 family)
LKNQRRQRPLAALSDALQIARSVWIAAHSPPLLTRSTTSALPSPSNCVHFGAQCLFPQKCFRCCATRWGWTRWNWTANHLVNRAGQRRYPIIESIPVLLEPAPLGPQNLKFQRMYDWMSYGYDFAMKVGGVFSGGKLAKLRRLLATKLALKPGDRCLYTSIGTGADVPYLAEQVPLESVALYETAFSGESRRVNIRLCFATGLAVLLVSAAGLFAGGSGLNVVVVVNQNSTNSVQLGNYYCERRGVPPQNLLRINWTGGNMSWNRNFETNLLNPLVSMLASRGLTNQVDYVVLSMDFPYQCSPPRNGNKLDHRRVVLRFQDDDCTTNCPAGIAGAICPLPVPTPMPPARASFARRRRLPPAATPGS